MKNRINILAEIVDMAQKVGLSFTYHEPAKLGAIGFCESAEYEPTTMVKTLGVMELLQEQKVLLQALQTKLTEADKLLEVMGEALEIASDTIGKPLGKELEPSEFVKHECKISGYVLHAINSPLAQYKNYKAGRE